MPALERPVPADQAPEESFEPIKLGVPAELVLPLSRVGLRFGGERGCLASSGCPPTIAFSSQRRAVLQKSAPTLGPAERCHSIAQSSAHPEASLVVGTPGGPDHSCVHRTAEGPVRGPPLPPVVPDPELCPPLLPLSSREDGGGGDVVASAAGLGFREASLGYRSAWAPTSASHQAMGRSVVSKDHLCLASCHVSSHLKKYLRTRTSVHSSVWKLRFSYNVAAPFSRSLAAQSLKGSSEQPARWLGTVPWREEEAWL